MSLWRHLWWTRTYFNVSQKNFFKEENVFTQRDVENKQLKEENEKLRKESEKLRKENEQLRKENEQLRKNNIVKDADAELIEKAIEIKIFKEDKNTINSYPNWFDKNKFKNILVIIDSNKFNYRHKMG